jgi:hypothetical protein
MKYKAMTKFILVLLIIAVGIIFAFQSRWFYDEENARELTKDLALGLVHDNLIEGECRSTGADELYRSCVIDLKYTEEEKAWLITVVYEGFFDDSVRGSRMRAKAVFENESWIIVGEPIEDFQCWSSRGHEDFSTELCI